ncbi:hypothetical protein L6452_39744 [Arctium lappa]|uniref:Uncharacterized protein n=1 Tax=Arctium lappa TaxID=4217 RepID=A0ACB8XSM9_ARCLA|nr:hypothetical protein L6452_39744 [Arctium lappa]
MGNLIVLFLLGESKFFASKSKAYKDVCHDKYKRKRSDQPQTISSAQELAVMRVSNDALEQETSVKISGSKTCNEGDQDEYFELCNDDGTCELDVDNMTKSFGHQEEDLSCSEQEVKVFEEENHEGLEGDGEVSLPAEELNKYVYPEELAGKVILITGASSGIGEHLAIEYAKEGVCLALVARRDKQLQMVARNAKAMGSPDVIAISADVSKHWDCNRFVEQTIKHFGKLDYLVNNAAIATFGFFEDQTHIPDHNPFMASKTTFLSFFESIRMELDSEVDITIVTLGMVDSIMTNDKWME